MLVFRRRAISIIAEYRKLLKRQIKGDDYLRKAAKLGVRAVDVRIANNVELYRKIELIIKQIKKNNDKVESHYYSGLNDYRAYLADFLKDYRVEYGRVVNLRQQTARCLVDTIQMLGHREKNARASREKLLANIDFLQRYAEGHQLNLIRNSLKIHPWGEELLNSVESSH